MSNIELSAANWRQWRSFQDIEYGAFCNLEQQMGDFIGTTWEVSEVSICQ